MNKTATLRFHTSGPKFFNMWQENVSRLSQFEREQERNLGREKTSYQVGKQTQVVALGTNNPLPYYGMLLQEYVLPIPRHLGTVTIYGLA